LLVTLLHLRDIADRDDTPFSIVSEMLDLRNRKLAKVANVNDFIVSNHLISLMMAQLSEDADLYAVFTDLFNPQGSEIYMKPVGDYVELGNPVNFYTLVEAARRRGQTAIRYRLAAEAGEASRSYGVHTNPQKSVPVSFTLRISLSSSPKTNRTRIWLPLRFEGRGTILLHLAAWEVTLHTHGGIY
jgi:ion channel POLLUX/CASTOR